MAHVVIRIFFAFTGRFAACRSRAPCGLCGVYGGHAPMPPTEFVDKIPLFV